MAIKAVGVPAGRPADRAGRARAAARADVEAERVSFVERHYAGELARWRAEAAARARMRSLAAEPAGLPPADISADCDAIREADAVQAVEDLRRRQELRRLLRAQERADATRPRNAD